MKIDLLRSFSLFFFCKYMYLGASKEFRSLKSINIELAKDLHFEDQIIIIINNYSPQCR